jgi:hypothetical protein
VVNAQWSVATTCSEPADNPAQRHHATRGMIPFAVEILALIQCQVLDQRFAVDPHAFPAGAADRFMGLLRRGVNDIYWNARGISDHDGAVGGLTLHLGRPRVGMGFGPGVAFAHVFLLQRGDNIAILGVDERQGAQRRASLERGEHLVVVDHQRAFVGHEVLERVYSLVDH